MRESSTLSAYRMTPFGWSGICRFDSITRQRSDALERSHSFAAPDPAIAKDFAGSRSNV
jgi:hypothetical protein